MNVTVQTEATLLLKWFLDVNDVDRVGVEFGVGRGCYYMAVAQRFLCYITMTISCYDRNHTLWALKWIKLLTMVPYYF